MNSQEFKVLLYGVGNPGRQDDGLGIVLAEEIEKWREEKGYLNIEIAQNYQLNIEDADKIAHYNMVIFADASMETVNPFRYEEVKPSSEIEFTMHAVVPSFILGLCQELFDSNVVAYQLHIKGEKWEFMEPLSSGAQENVRQAICFIKNELEKYLVPEIQIT
jgi:hydrogenase maturation protease